jgi:hypothetical protein
VLAIEYRKKPEDEEASTSPSPPVSTSEKEPEPEPVKEVAHRPEPVDLLVIFKQANIMFILRNNNMLNQPNISNCTC